MSKETFFNIEQNPQDMQMMSDGMMYVPLLRQMGEEDRKAAWPGIVDRLAAVSPKAEEILDRSITPTDEMLDGLMSQMPQGEQTVETQPSRQGYLDDQVKRQLRGEQPISPEEYAKQQQTTPTPQSEVPAQDEAQGSAMEAISQMAPDQMSDDDIINAAKDQGGMGQQVWGSSKEDKPPAGTYWIDPNDKTKGYVKYPEVDAEGNPVTKKLTSEQAQRQAMIQMANAELPTIQKLTFDENGQLKRGNVWMSNLPGPIGSVPFTEGDQLAKATDRAVGAILRAETGAQEADKESMKMAKRYIIDYTDSQDSAIQKYLALKLYAAGYLKLMESKDSAKYQEHQAKIQRAISNYKERWMQDAVKANPGVPIEAIQKLYYKSLLYNPTKFMKQFNKYQEQDQAQE